MPSTSEMISGSFCSGELQANAAHYDAAFRRIGLTVGSAAATVQPGDRHIYDQYVIRVPDRDRVHAYLAECGVGTEVYCPDPLHMAPPTDRVSGEVQLQYVVDAISDFFGRG